METLPLLKGSSKQSNYFKESYLASKNLCKIIFNLMPNLLLTFEAKATKIFCRTPNHNSASLSSSFSSLYI